MEKRNLWRFKILKLFLVGIIFGALVFLNPNNFFKPVRSALFFLTLPLQKTFFFASSFFKESFSFVFSIQETREENERLLEENYRLRSAEAILAEIKKENDFLREQVGLLPRENFDIQAASVIARDSYDLGNWLRIDQGKNSGLSENMPVIIGGGILVGRLEEVDSHSAKVVLLTNPESAVNVMDVESGAKGLARGEFGLGILMDMVLPDEGLKEGDKVVTSGLGNQMPRGLLLGRISEIKMSKDGLFRQAILRSSVKIDSLYHVFVIKGKK